MKKAIAGNDGEIIRFILWNKSNRKAGSIDIWDWRVQIMRKGWFGRRISKFSKNKTGEKILVELLQKLYDDFYLSGNDQESEGDVTMQLHAMEICGTKFKYISKSRIPELKKLLGQYLKKKYIPKF